MLNPRKEYAFRMMTGQLVDRDFTLPPGVKMQYANMLDIGGSKEPTGRMLRTSR